MKINTQPIHIIQVFSNSYDYDKLYKDFNSRKEWVQWKEKVESNTSIGERILLNQKAFENKTGTLGNLVILLDSNYYTFEDFLLLKKLNNESAEQNEENSIQFAKWQQTRCDVTFGVLDKHLLEFAIFKIKNEDNIELFLEWDYWKVGAPERANFKLAELKLNQPIQVKIDGTRDFSLTGRRKRTFIEHSYILEYKGLFNQVEKMNHSNTYSKTIPNNFKEVNLLNYVK